MKQELKEKLSKYNQEHVLAFWDELTVEEKQTLENQVEKMDLELISKLYEGTKAEEP